MASIMFAALQLSGAGSLLIAQQTSSRTRSENARAERIANIDALRQKLRQYHDCTCTCGCYAHDLDLQANRAIAFLRRRVAHKRADEKLAIVLDIDETSLSNYEELNQSSFTYVKRDFNAWIETAKAPAIPGTLRLFNEAQKLGVSVFFITGRPESQRAITEQNLNQQGYANWQKLMMRSESAATQSTIPFKSSMRAQIVGEGYKLILSVGDQWSDLKGTPLAEYSVKYPDPFYLIP
jgi:acid phosphatase